MSSATFEAWVNHARTCPRCRVVDLGKPATLAGACLDGSKLAKDAYSCGRKALEKEQREKARAA